MNPGEDLKKKTTPFSGALAQGQQWLQHCQRWRLPEVILTPGFMVFFFQKTDENFLGLALSPTKKRIEVDSIIEYTSLYWLTVFWWNSLTDTPRDQVMTLRGSFRGLDFCWPCAFPPARPNWLSSAPSRTTRTAQGHWGWWGWPWYMATVKNLGTHYRVCQTCIIRKIDPHMSTSITSKLQVEIH